MSYRVITSPEADADLHQLPEILQTAIIRAMFRLAESPAKSSHPAPAVYGGMLYSIEIPYDEMTCYADVLFRYTQDEQTLYVERVFVEFA